MIKPNNKHGTCGYCKTEVVSRGVPMSDQKAEHYRSYEPYQQPERTAQRPL